MGGREADRGDFLIELPGSCPKIFIGLCSRTSHFVQFLSWSQTLPQWRAGVGVGGTLSNPAPFLGGFSVVTALPPAPSLSFVWSGKHRLSGSQVPRSMSRVTRLCHQRYPSALGPGNTSPPQCALPRQGGEVSEAGTSDHLQVA